MYLYLNFLEIGVSLYPIVFVHVFVLLSLFSYNQISYISTFLI